MSVNKNIVVAIDGPSASGKSTVSKQVAKALNVTYVDSGSLYRGMTWKVLRSKVDVKDAEAVIDVKNKSKWFFYRENNVVYFEIDGEDPYEELRSERIRENVSDVAAIPEIRQFIVQQLRDMRRFGTIVMEGRDIGSVVFADSPWKYYLDADPEERARRRFKELKVTEGEQNVDHVLNSLQRRDKKDTTRKTAPLQIALGADVVNTTNMSIDDVVNYIVEKIKAADQQE